MKRPKPKTLADCAVGSHGKPKCFHCEKLFPKRSKVELNGFSPKAILIVQCPYCDCMTPFRVT